MLSSTLLDDFGLATLNADHRRDLLEILEDRYATRSTLVTSQLPIEKWHDLFGDPTFADAILDRLVHNAYKLKLKGDSMRKTPDPIDPSRSLNGIIEHPRRFAPTGDRLDRTG